MHFEILSEILSEIVRNLPKKRPNISRPIISRPKFLRPKFLVINVIGEPTKKSDRESAIDFVDERVPLSILNNYDESIAAKSIRNINIAAKKETVVVRSFRSCCSELPIQT